MKTAGIDGCEAGWLLISFDKDHSKYEILRTDREFEETFEQYDRIFINIPIGLKEEEYTRECDDLLRKKLGPEYASSVFSPPIRPALHAPTYVEANMQCFELTGNKLPLHAWHITPKVKVVDELLQKKESWREKVFESHPELLFMNLNGGMIYQKKNTKKGLKHRLDLVSVREKIAKDYFREIKEEFRRNEVEEDDIVDAMALAFAAKKSEETGIKSMPENKPSDSKGLRMAVHFI